MPDKWAQYAQPSTGDKWAQYAQPAPAETPPPAPSMTANPRGEGTYLMWDDKGQKIPVPYSQVPSDQQKGYKFDTNPTPEAGYFGQPSMGLTPEKQYQKDHAYDKNGPSAMQQVGTGIAKGGMTLVSPAAHLMQATIPENERTPLAHAFDADTPLEKVGKWGTIGGVMAPAAIAAPGATAGGLVGGTLGGMAGGAAARKMGLNENQTELLSDAGGLAGGIAGAKIAGPAISMFPSKARAVQTLNEVSQAAKDVPVQMTATDPAVGGFKQYVATGGRGTPVINKLAKRMAATDKQGPLMFPEARQFYTNVSRSSARPGFLRRAIESPSAPDMRRNLGNVREAMSNDLTDTAGSVGMGDKYTQGMTEYKNAARLNRAAKVGGTIAAEEALRRSGLLGKIASGAANMAGR